MVGFLDTLNPRFWQLHSTSPAGEVARVVRAVVGSDPRLDTAWLPKSLLRDLDGEHLWVKSAFEADELLGADVSARRWRARFEGDAPRTTIYGHLDPATKGKRPASQSTPASP